MKNLRSLLFALLMTLCGMDGVLASDDASRSKAEVIQTYVHIAEATYADALSSARELQTAVNTLIKQPTPENLQSARSAWLAARVPYQQTEVFRFGNQIVDDWEGKVNAWPLDEGMIDYVARDYGATKEENELYAANVIANPELKVGGKRINAKVINESLLQDKLHEAGGVEANVATGYHAIEFLLWGQDLNGTGVGAGARPFSDYDTANCTNGHCQRRAQYLRAATDLLVNDLQWMTAQWGENGEARKTLFTASPDAGLIALFTGMGSLSYGELAGERMKLGLLLNDPEEEHDCFSDNTHNSHFYNALGILNVYLGRYKRRDGSIIAGPSVSGLVKAKDVTTDTRMQAALSKTMRAMTQMKQRAEAGEAYDQMIGEGNTTGNAVIQSAIDALIAQTREIKRAVSILQLKAVQFEGSDSLDSPGATK